MKSLRFVLVLLAAPMMVAQSAAPARGVQPVPSMSRTPQPTTAVYVDAAALGSATVVAPPPGHGSAAEAADLAEVHAVMSKASAAETATAQTDANAESIFLFANVLGPGFNAKALPLTAAFSDHLINDARLINLSLKQHFGRPRPFVTDPTLHPTCGLLREPSYPSGHAMNGYLTAYALTEMVPEKADAILARADEYARNRLVCGEHYPTDLAAGRAVALEIFGNILANARYRQDLAAARAETRKALHLQP